MNCPVCQYQHPNQDMPCPQCGLELSRDDLTQLDRLYYLRRRLEEWGASGVLPQRSAIRALFATQTETAELERKLGVAAARGTAAETGTCAACGQQNHPRSATCVSCGRPLRAAPAPMPASVAAPAPPREAKVGPGPTIATDGQPAPARPRVPQFSWSEVGSYLLSERTLNGLLGLGALLILAAGVVISTFNPTRLSPLPHLIAVVVTALVFYAAGYAVRQKLQLERSGEALFAIGAGFVPLVIWTLGQSDFLNLGAATIGLVASTLCLPIYFASHALLRDRIFALLTAAAAASEVLAATHLAGVPLEFGACGLVVLAYGVVLLSVRLPASWKTLAEALSWAARVATPAVMLTLLASSFYPEIWTTIARAKEGVNFAYAVGAAWWLGAGFYALAARIYRRPRFEYVAAWAIPLAYLFTLTKAPWPAAWYGVCLALLAGLYILVGRRVQRLLADTPKPSLQVMLLQPAYQVGLALTVATAAWPSATLESASATFVLLAAIYGGAAYVFRHRLFAYAAVFSVPIALGLELEHLQPSGDVRALAWAALGAGLLLCAELAARRSGEHRRPLTDTLFRIDTSRSPFASPLFSAGYLVILAALGLALLQYLTAPGATVRHMGVPVIAAFLVIVAALGVSALTRRSANFLYPATWLMLIPVTSTASLLAQHLGLHPTDLDWVRVLAAMGVGYLAVAVFVGRFGEPYARAIYLVGYALSVLTVALALPDRSITVEVLGLSILVYAWSAWRVQRDRHPSFIWAVKRLCGPETHAFGILRWFFLALATWLFPIWLVLAFSLHRPSPSPAQYGVVLAVLAPAYAAVGLRFRRFGREGAFVWYVAGYTMSVLGPALAAGDLHVFVAVLAVSIGLYSSSAAVSRWSAWLYPALTSTLILCLAITYVIWPSVAFARSALVLIPPIWLMFTAAHVVARGRAFGRWKPLGSAPIDFPWSQPLLVVGSAALGISVAGSASDPGPGLVAALAGLFLTFGLSVLWRAEAATWTGLVLAIVAGEQAFLLEGIPGANQAPSWAAAGLILALLCCILPRETGMHWSRPLSWVSIGVGLGAVVAAAGYGGGVADQSLALTVGITGLSLIAHGYNRRNRYLGYAGVAALLIGCMIELAVFNVGRPQAFVVPAGLYLLSIAYFEWRRGMGQGIKSALEITALVLLLGTSLLQAVGLFNVGGARYAYDTYLLVESVALLGVGATLKWRKPFFAGGIALVADILIMLAVPLRSLNTWYLVAIIGLTMIGLVILAERKRRQIPVWADTWHQRLESWS